MTTIPIITDADLAAARQLVSQRQHLTQRLRQLSKALADNKATELRISTTFNERVAIRRDPNRLAGYAEVYQRNNPPSAVDGRAVSRAAGGDD